MSFAEPHSPFTGPFDDLYAAEDMTLPESWYLSMDETVPLHVRRLREAYASGYMGTWPRASSGYGPTTSWAGKS